MYFYLFYFSLSYFFIFLNSIFNFNFNPISLLSFIHWNPSRFAFTIPIIEHPVAWYGIFFASGFLLAYFVVKHMFYFYLSHIPDHKKVATELLDKLLWFIAIGMIVGARLGHVIFYDGWGEYEWIEIFQIWKGGLASHGGAVGIILAVYFYVRGLKKEYSLNFFRIFDCIVVSTGLVGFFIRLGNFVNQEIIGIETTVPWAVIFEAPFESASIVPRHPVQLYEGVFYFLLFVALFFIWLFKRENLKNKDGLLTGVFFILTFGFRFFIEKYKVSQSALIAESSFFSMGQLLSVPFILLGFAIIFYSLKGKGRFARGSLRR